MCGIAGFVDHTTAPEVRQEAVARMCAAMVHRGPDDAGVETQGAATIGMRRLAIFDPRHGHQPMTTPDGRYRLVFNGAIYNFRELRGQLSSGGYRFQTDCDTEVLLAAYALWGETCLTRLRGMFAFAVWDALEQTLFFARDPFGIKPLYYRQSGGRLVFASEINALIAGGTFDGEVDPMAVADYLGWLAVPAPRTIYRDVSSLRPGQSGRFRHGRLELGVGWNFRAIPRDARPAASREEFTRELRARLDDTIRAHVLADVPVGAFLSGGLDSAAVVGLMTHATGARLKTFSIAFNESDYSESAAAEATARHFGTEHHTHVLTGTKVAGDLERILAAYDQPTGDGINTFYASQAARAGGLTVALSGLGGDELFGGYPSFRAIPRLADWLPLWRWLPGPLRGTILTRLRRRDTRARKLADLLEHTRDIHEIGALYRLVFAETTRRSLLGADVRTALGTRAPNHPELLALTADLAGADTFQVVSAWELRTYMADVLLRDSDVMSMRHSLELRVPLVDRPLIEWLWCQPSAFKSTPAQPKSALAAAVADLLPPGVASRRKQGFSLPFGLWMKNELRPFLDDTFSAGSAARSGLFDPVTVQDFWRNYLAHDDTRQWSRVWSLAVAIHFANRRRTAPPSAALRTPVLLDSPAPVAPATPATKHRTLLLAPEIFASEGGIPRILQLYLKALCELAEPNEDEIRLVALNDAVVDSRDLRRSANDRLTDWHVCSRHKSSFVRACFELSRGCDRIVCGHIAQLPVALAAKALNPRLKYYLVAHGIEVWRPFKLAEKWALRRAERIFCVSDYTRQELLRRCPLPEGKAVVLHNALDPFFHIVPAGRPPGDTQVILVVTRLTWADRYKGVEDMVRAMPAIRAARPHTLLRIIGRGDDLPRLQAMRRDLGLDGAIEFLGYVDDRRLTAEIRACTLFALPSKKEGFGLVFLEAMANGRPCLGARAGGVPEVISPESGVLIEYGDVPGIAAACVAALDREWDEEAILNRARHFSYSQFRDRLGSLLDAS